MVLWAQQGSMSALVSAGVLEGESEVPEKDRAVVEGDIAASGYEIAVLPQGHGQAFLGIGGTEWAGDVRVATL
ncbi:hypothetical protein N7532_001959 [Penicillium argentinense]|uniref:Uncharacterized protein n=1 Tax=Penicillium argentinense TaxID=1131581 RepID=A0A9W9ENM1_9EURO|nr:uncharacterized protein N7532_009810 [Penicillium argentinense]XP_056475857.1 uncharacterized protein N7532_003006 [Penicillium argentinense]XP_056479494.1 uncharacterized protein N7532_001959 [Penicillium argentinense]KAJ5085039.1 hypothetical protein N7532_009810 [Penicillium argentinense]KAJ5102477.1 hypothetical protein N7532_003006 [Penicillium argentinense]KAJ5111424.1 hypothetical protein N7532_001959 [Penicillium argentinense]